MQSRVGTSQRRMLSLLLGGSRHGFMVWEKSYLKWWRGGLACFTSSVAASWGASWTLSQLHHFYSVLFYYTSSHKICWSGCEASEVLNKGNFCSVCKPIWKYGSEIRLDRSHVSTCSSQKSFSKNSDKCKHKDQLLLTFQSFQTEFIQQTHMWCRVLLLPGWLLWSIIRFPACFSITDAFVHLVLTLTCASLTQVHI